MNIRIKKVDLNQAKINFLRELQCSVTLDKNSNAYIISLPNTLELFDAGLDVYYLLTLDGKKIGHVVKPFLLSGGSFDFAI